MNPDIQNTAAEIKKYFYDFKRQQLGKPYSPADRFRKPEIWTAAAERCAELKADPFNFVRAAFLYNNVPGGPYPHQMTGSAVGKWYGEFCRVNGASGMTQLEVTTKEVKDLMINSLRIVMDQKYTRVRDYLLDDYGARLDVIPAYIRVFILPDDPDIMKKWGRLATQELNSNPHLIEVVQKLGYKTDFTANY